MFNTRQTILASRPAAMVLALALVAGLSAPFLMLPRVHAAPATPPALPCTEANNNGCTELSAIPPQDNVSVPPNIVLMLDDSGSMNWDFMPDWTSLALDASGTQTPGWNKNNDGVRNPSINFVYYNPGTVYAAPPHADSTATAPNLYPDASFPSAFRDGFTSAATVNVTTYTGGDPNVNTFPYYTRIGTQTTDYGPASPVTVPNPVCPGGYSLSGGLCVRAPSNPSTSTTWKCNAGDVGPTSYNGQSNMCRHGSGESATWYKATPTTSAPYCPAGSTGPAADGKCHWPSVTPNPPSTTTNWTCPKGSPNGAKPTPECVSNRAVYAFTYATGPAGGPYQEHYVAANKDCGYATAAKAPDCVNAGDISGTSAPSGVAAGQNVANWFSYYRTRLLMSKSGLMNAFLDLDPSARFGFGSINGGNLGDIPSLSFTFDDLGCGPAGDPRCGNQNNLLAEVQPFNDGSSGTQKAAFWTWLANEAPPTYGVNKDLGQTPLRMSLNAVGQYYQTQSQPWSTMPGDPGYTPASTTQFACRASYAILMTDGFWNGSPPTVAGMTGAANSNGTVQTVPPGDIVTQYLAQAPFLGGATSGEGPSLADVATYYWENDLQTGMLNEVSGGPDPAAWQHMTTFTIGLGFKPVGITPSSVCDPTSDANCASIFAWAQGGAAIAGWNANTSWPTPSGTANAGNGSVNNIADLVHAAVNGHGGFANALNAQQLTDALNKFFGDIGDKYIEPTTASVNATVLSLGALSFSTGYNTHDWSGVLEAVTLNTGGTVNQVLWKDGFDKNLPSPASIIDTSYHSAAGAAGRTDVWTDSYTVSSGVGTLTPFQFDTANANSLDSTENSAGQGLQSPALAGAKDTVDHRILYLLGDNTYELTGLYRTRSSILGAILRSEPLYVAGATGNYFDSWPNNPDGTVAAEAASGAQHFDDFVTQQAKQPGMVYVGANDGMLHAFYAPVPQCSSGAVDPTTGNCSSYTFGTGTNPGVEAWAFIPRAVYANLGNLTLAANFSFRPTVDAAPVRRDVFFANNWHTILAGGVGLGGRGVYALDVTNAGSFSAANVLWEFDSDMIIPAGCTSIQGSGADSIGCRATDLGYTVSQPNIARLNTGKWAVLVPNGYFPDCSAANGDIPTADTASCNVVAHQAPIDASGNPYSALFVLDAESGKVIAELKTPSGIPAIDGSGTVTSFGLATPVMGDYQGDQVDDVAFAGDVEGNLWRFDLSDPSPANWTVTLVYQGLFVTDASGTHQGVQPITTMPRLFPDPVTNRFMVVFGTGKFLGVGDNSNATAQALIAVRDIPGKTYDQTTGLTQQYLHESTAASGPYAGLSLRCVTGGAGDTCSTATPVTTVPGSGTGSGGWYINLSTTTSGGTINDAGERVVVNPGAIFASNTVVFETLITGSQTSDACNPAMQGSILALSATTGASAGVSALGGGQIAGARITNARTSGSLPLVSALGGGQSYIPGSSLAPSGKSPMSIDAPIWRRRSWQEIQQNQ